MALGEATINVRVKMSSVKPEMDKAKAEIETAGKGLDKPAQSFGDSWKAAKAAILPVVASIGAAIVTMKKVIDFAKEGAEIQRLGESSGALARSMGMDMDEVVGAIRGASLGMISDYEIMQSASKAMMLGVGKDSGQLAQLMEVAALRGRAMGLSTTQAFNDIVTGIGRASPMILDNLGIVIDADSTYASYGESIGKAGNQLTKAEKTQALLNGVLKSTAGLLAETGGLVLDNAGKWEQLEAAENNYWNGLKVSLANGTTGWADFWTARFNEAAAAEGLVALVKEANQLGINTDALEKAYQAYAVTGKGKAKLVQEQPELVAALQAEVDAVNATTNAWAGSNQKVADNIRNGAYELGKGGDAWKSYQEIMADPTAYGKNSEYQQQLASDLAKQNAELAKQKELYEKVFSVTANFSGITKLAQDYTTQLENISAAEERIAELEPFSKTGGTLDGVKMSAEEVNEELAKQKELIEAAQEAMTKSANQMALDMFANSIAIDGATETEMQAYFDMAVKMGIVSQEAADKAMQAWQDAVNLIEGNPANPKVQVDTEPARLKILELMQMDISPINIPITYTVSTVGNMPNVNIPLPRADGGPTARGMPYWVGERGEPELFIPQENGHIVNQDTIIRALQSVTNNNSNANISYNLTMPTSNSPTQVRSAFELMQLLGV